MNETRIAQLASNLTKKTNLRKLLLNELNYGLNEVRKVQKGINEIIEGLEAMEEAKRIRAEQQKAKMQKVIDALQQEGVSLNELQTFLGKTKKKTQKKACKEESTANDSSADLTAVPGTVYEERELDIDEELKETAV